jgi:hypothetical protein
MALNGDISENINVGDHIFCVEFTNDKDTGSEFKSHEFIIDELLDAKNKEHIKDIELTEKPFVVKMHDIKYPTIAIKQDIAFGFFTDVESAMSAFIDMIQQIFLKCKSSYLKITGHEWAE